MEKTCLEWKNETELFLSFNKVFLKSAPPRRRTRRNLSTGRDCRPSAWGPSETASRRRVRRRMAESISWTFLNLPLKFKFWTYEMVASGAIEKVNGLSGLKRKQNSVQDSGRIIHIRMNQGCTIYGPLAKCGPQELFIWPAKTNFFFF